MLNAKDRVSGASHIQIYLFHFKTKIFCFLSDINSIKSTDDYSLDGEFILKTLNSNDALQHALIRSLIKRIYIVFLIALEAKLAIILKYILR